MMVNLRKKLFSRAESGQAIVIIALAMIAVLGFAILALDGGRYYSQRRINQNAADAASLAAIYYFSHNESTRTPAGAWAAAVAAAQANGIVNTSAQTSDGRRVVQAFWLDNNGTVIIGGEFTDTTSTSHSAIPTTATAVKVTTRIEYDTFMLGILGQKRLTAEASSVARETVVVAPPSQTAFPYSGYYAGVECDNGAGNVGGSPGSTKYAVEWYDGNNGGYHGDLYVRGNAAFLSTNVIDMRGKAGETDTHKVTVTNYVDVLLGINIKHQNPNNVEPGLFFAGGTNTVSAWSSPSNPVNGSGTSSNTAGIWEASYPSVLTALGHLLDADDFEPAHAAVTGGYMYTYWVSQNPGVDPTTKWHYRNGQAYTALQNGDWIRAQMNAGQTGIFWVDGNVSLVQDGHDPTDGTSIIATGTVDFTAANNKHFGSAGDMAANISILANKNWGAGFLCANSDSGAVTHWAINTNANQSYYDGFLYAPYGLVLFEGNGNNGHYQAWGVYSNSLRVGDGSGDTGANMNFDYQKKFNIPIPTSGLMGNQ